MQRVAQPEGGIVGARSSNLLQRVSKQRFAYSPSSLGSSPGSSLGSSFSYIHTGVHRPVHQPSPVHTLTHPLGRTCTWLIAQCFASASPRFITKALPVDMEGVVEGHRSVHHLISSIGSSLRCTAVNGPFYQRELSICCACACVSCLVLLRRACALLLV